ncbi:MucR family transcriptional regulator [Billgrantia gudaonensis]|uniref:ROS/MUCR transcriptional regulator protein n=1 Tax=Billgrantia gudaonensis TaxID=376427 RepID=A0A1G8XDD4_9GAMM|nr:MucR family transcriptional regulator [Halomonas gudaonensis]SDJ88618.1 ROS/MUCR transcriptional regulator protein [Halomonas gudaonensis]
MRKEPFQSLEELDAYVGGPKIQCLECGRWFRGLATHLPRTHGMTHADYREKWGIPRRYPLTGTATRETLSQQMRDQIDAGVLTHDHLPDASQAARQAGRSRKRLVDDERHRRITAERRPGDHHRLPPGAKRADGRDADRRREYQIAYRALKRGDSEPMQRYRARYLEAPSDDPT